MELTDEFKTALAALDEGRNLFLTGKAGTGKSTLIRHFMQKTDRQCVVVAPTGIAALNVDGYTIHRLFSFSKSSTVDHVLSGKYYPRKFSKTLKTLDTLIIDEASMVRADLFDALAVALGRFGPKPGDPFGGVQVVLVGDLYQLPPVVVEAETELFATRYKTPFFFSADNFCTDHFLTVQLSRVFRQAGDSELTDILNAIREGTISQDSRAVLNARTQPAFTPPDGEFWLTLATTNRIANARNREALDRIPGEALTSIAAQTGEKEDADPPAEEQLNYKVGAQVMMLINDPSDRFANGTLGTIIATDENTDGPLVTIKTNQGEEVTVGLHTWQVRLPVSDGKKITHEVVGTYTQLPFKLAWAITIHKSQGQTVERLIVDLTGGTFACGQLYVALSRCTSMQGLVLTRGVEPKDMKIDHRVRRFLANDQDYTAAPRAYLGICTAGKEGRNSRPRPVEIAAVCDDGTEISTLINPESDLYESRSDYGIGAADVIAAPKLCEAWPALLATLQGHIPVGVNIDQTLGWIDYELKRTSSVFMMPLGDSIDWEDLTPVEQKLMKSQHALQRARAVRDVAKRLGLESATCLPFDKPTTSGYLLPRGTRSKVIAVGDNSWTVVARQRAQSAKASDDLSILVPGARVCFTGTVLDDRGRKLDRADMEQLASDHGLTPVASVTKARCDVLICAEAESQSRKAKQARGWDKPVIKASAFLRWCETNR